MSNVIAFRRCASEQLQETEIDPLTAIDAAIRDLADIIEGWGSDSALVQAEECRRMLSHAYSQALAGSACGCARCEPE